MNTKGFYLLLPFFALNIVQADVSLSTFKMDWTDLTLFRDNALIRTRTAKSLTLCSVMCAADNSCSLFIFTNGSSTCELGQRQSAAVSFPELGGSQEVYIKDQCSLDDTCPSTPSLVDHVSPNSRFEATSKLFVDECEDWNARNYWKGQALDYFVLDLGCCREVSSVTLKNIQNVPVGHNRLPDRSTDGFRILLSTNQAYDSDNAVMKWDCVVKDNLQDGRAYANHCDIPLETFTFRKQPARFVKFIVDSFFGITGGLNYIKVD